MPTQRAYARAYVLTPSGVGDLVRRRSLLSLRRASFAQGRTWGGPCVIEVTAASAEALTDWG